MKVYAVVGHSAMAMDENVYGFFGSRREAEIYKRVKW